MYYVGFWVGLSSFMKTQDVFPDGLKLFFLVFLKDPIPRRFLALVLI